MADMTAAIEVSGLSHVYGGTVPALEDISFSVPAGRFTVIVGPSGCGKTSLLMMLAGLRAQSQGRIHVLGKPIPAPDPSPGGPPLGGPRRVHRRRVRCAHN